MTAKNQRITELDFDTIKANLKTFLSGQSEFSDYNFEGSALSTLLDVLAFNTHYTSFYANMLANEMFLDTAVKRSSVVSLAKHLGYTPRSARGAVAVVNIEAIIPDGDPTPQGVTLPAYTVFGSSGTGVGSQNVFFNQEEKIVSADEDNRFIFEGVELTEGSLNRARFVYSSATPDRKLIIPNRNVDTSTLKVTVQTSADVTTQTTFVPATNYTNITGIDPVYFLQEVDGEMFQIYFGDDSVGKALVDGNIVIVQYLVVTGPDANGLSEFTCQTTLPSTEDENTAYAATVTTLDPASGGALIESIDSIRFYAPKAWTSQNRLVTKEDYEHYIQQTFPNVESVAIWGGEDNIPPQYGKVFISLKPFSGFRFSNIAKQNFVDNFLAQKTLVSITPEFVDPEYIYVGVHTVARYNAARTVKTADQIATIVRNTIVNYFDNTLEKFNTNFYYSNLSSTIDDCDPAMVSNQTIITLQKRLLPTLFRKLGYTVSFAPNQIRPSSLSTSHFNVVVNGLEYDNASYRDIPDQLNFSTSYDGTGTIQIVSSTGVVLYANAGTIDYATGVITLVPIEFLDALTNDGYIRFTVDLQEDSRDVIVQRNNIIVLDDTVTDATIGLNQQGLTVETTQV